MLRVPRRSLSFESLESKQLLAGDVTVSVVAGNLLIKGDEAGNHVAISQGTDANSFVIRGLEGTTVKMAGSSTPAPETGLVVTGIKGQVNVNMLGGNDAVDVTGAQFRRGLSVETGAGNDAVAMQNVSVGGFLSVITGDGDDSVQLGTTTTPTAAAAVNDSNASVKAGLEIDVVLGEGVDSAQLNSVSAPGAVFVGGGLGADTLGIHNVRTVSLVVNGGLGDGVDQIDVSQAKAVAAVITTGGGADRVGIVDASFTSLNIALGGGDDALSLQKVKSKVTVLAGGEGSGDSFTGAGENSLGLRVVTGFELPTDANTVTRPLPRLGNLLANLLGRIRA
jgi:hypothetical protein